MEAYLKNKKNNWYTAPNNIVGVLVNPITGELIKDTDKKGKIFYFIKGTEPYTENSYDLDSVFKEEKEENLSSEDSGENNENRDDSG